MTYRTTVRLPGDLVERARRRALEQGISFSAYLRELVEREVGGRRRDRRDDGGDLFDPVPLPDDVDVADLPRDGAEHHDKYFARSRRRKSRR